MTTPNIFSFRLDGGRIVLAVPGWHEPDEHFPNRATAERMFAELAVCLGPCTWAEDENGAWDTTCGNKYEFTEGTPKQNRFKRCPYCGKAVAESKPPAGPVK